MHKFWKSFLAICQMIKIEHSIFALPYAWAGAFLAARGLPAASVLLWLTVAMVAVRSFAMTFNRIADLENDRHNPRTSKRPLVTGTISLPQAWVFCVIMGLAFIAACALLNKTCLILSVPTLIFVGIYSFMKRVTPMCHFWLGASLGLAPIAGWLAIQPATLGMAPILLCMAVIFWVGAFDVYYAFQDLDYDMRTGTHSIPADYGTKSAMLIAGFSHIMTVIFLLLTGVEAKLGWPWYVLCGAIAILLLVEHKLVQKEDLRYINMAFFTLNGIISPLMLAGIILGIYF